MTGKWGEIARSASKSTPEHRQSQSAVKLTISLDSNLSYTYTVHVLQIVLFCTSGNTTLIASCTWHNRSQAAGERHVRLSRNTDAHTVTRTRWHEAFRSWSHQKKMLWNFHSGVLRQAGQNALTVTPIIWPPFWWIYFCAEESSSSYNSSFWNFRKRYHMPWNDTEIPPLRHSDPKLDEYVAWKIWCLPRMSWKPREIPRVLAKTSRKCLDFGVTGPFTSD